MPHNNKIVGLILAAGESKRMGTDKALLKLASGRTLLEDQVLRLNSAGIDKVFVVVGCNAVNIISAHRDLNVEWVENKNWRMGSFSSVSVGINTVCHSEQSEESPEHRGSFASLRMTEPCIILLPIDCINVAVDSIKKIIAEGLRTNRNIIPTFNGVGGHPVFLSSNFVEALKAAPVATSRLDELLEKDDTTHHLKVIDKNILNNINTIETWLEYMSTSS